MRVRLLHPFGNGFVGDIVDIDRDVARRLIMLGIAQYSGSHSKEMEQPQHDKMIRKSRVTTK